MLGFSVVWWGGLLLSCLSGFVGGCCVCYGLLSLV